MAKSVLFKVRCSPNEKADYERAAREADLSLSEWIRQSLNDAAKDEYLADFELVTKPQHTGFSGTPVEKREAENQLYAGVKTDKDKPSGIELFIGTPGPLADVHPALADLGKRSYEPDFKTERKPKK